MTLTLNVAHRSIVALACALAAGCSSLPAAQVARVGDTALAWRGQGAADTTVVFQSGLGDDMTPWTAVLERLPPSVATFTYDRPGYGASRPAPTTPRTPCDIARELHAGLVASGARPPYVLVGHSLGGQYQYAFAMLFPQEVAGLLLLDPTHPDHWPSLLRETPAAASTIRVLRATAFSAAMRAEFDGQSRCLDALPSPSAPPPTRILASTRPEVGESAAFRSVVARLRADWLTKLPGATLRPVDGAGHYIHKDKPAVVAEEIVAILDKRSRPAP